MGKVFDIEGPFMSGLTKIADIIILNTLFLICSLPIFTIGATTTAMYYVTLKMVKDEECYMVKGFFKSFKQNFLQATGIWLIILAVAFLLYEDFRISSGQIAQAVEIPETLAMLLIVFLIAASIFFIFTVLYVFPVLSKFDNTVKNTIKNSFIMAISHLPSTIAIVLITFIPLILIYLVPQFFIFIFAVFGFIAYGNSFLFMRIFKKYIPEEVIANDEQFSIEVDVEAENE